MQMTRPNLAVYRDSERLPEDIAQIHANHPFMSKGDVFWNGKMCCGKEVLGTVAPAFQKETNAMCVINDRTVLLLIWVSLSIWICLATGAMIAVT